MAPAIYIVTYKGKLTLEDIKNRIIKLNRLDCVKSISLVYSRGQPANAVLVVLSTSTAAMADLGMLSPSGLFVRRYEMNDYDYPHKFNHHPNSLYIKGTPEFTEAQFR